MNADKYTKRRFFDRFFIQTFIASVIFILVHFPFTVQAFDILLGTGTAGSFPHFVGRTICRVLNKSGVDFSCKVMSATADVLNLTNLQNGSLDIILIDSLVLHDAINKRGHFEYLDISYDNLRTVVSLYDVPITLVVRSDAGINSLEGLKGKRINAGAPSSLQHLVVDAIMKVKNWSKKDFQVFEELSSSHAQDTMAFCHDTIQAMLHVGVHPDSSLQQLFRLCEANLIKMDDMDVEKLITDHQAFSRTQIKGGTYLKHKENLATFGTSVLLVASGDLDDLTVTKIMDAIYSNQQQLTRAHPALSSLAVGKARMKDIGIQMHPGALKYLLEKGL